MLEMLSAARARGPRLAEALSSALAAVRGADSVLFPACRRAAVLLIDGLGADQLRRFSGYTRHLRAQAAGRMLGCFPTTTAVALTSLTTGLDPLAHGVLEYQLYDEERREAQQMLSGWRRSADTARWAVPETVFEQAAAAGVPAVAIGPAKFATSGFTALSLRGAEYRPTSGVPGMVSALQDFLAEPGPGIAYAYAPDVDHAGHAHGVGSPEHLRALDEIDQALGTLRVPRGTSVLATADHGMLNPARHRLLQEVDGFEDDVRLVVGEPRLSGLVLRRPERAEEVAARVAAALGGAFEVVTTAALCDSGLLGEGPDRFRSRLGQVCVIGVDADSVLYDERTAAPGSLAMVGQHGGAHPRELMVPLLRW
jgi:hypothetical protein